MGAGTTFRTHRIVVLWLTHLLYSHLLVRVRVLILSLKYIQASEGLSTKDAGARFDELGPNEVPFKPESIWVSIGEEMFTMFRVYQFLIYAIWLWYAYIFVGALLFVIVLVAAGITIVNRRRGQYAIAKVQCHF